ncbi:MAG TPA: hypothetical protein VFU47_01165, partial [Armatimonadota bacterium]|nr:hypothetical protein [Armatimonadota bacterium]
MKRYVPLLALVPAGMLLAGCPNGNGGAEGGRKSSYAANMGQAQEPASVAGKYGGKMIESTISDPKSFNYWGSAETSTSDAVGPLYDSLTLRNSYT